MHGAQIVTIDYRSGDAGYLAGPFASPEMFDAFMTGADAILFVAVLQETHRLAFADELAISDKRRSFTVIQK